VDDVGVKVHGIADLQRALRDVDRDLPKELAAGLAEAAEIVASAAAPKVPRRTGAAAASIKVKKQQRAASLAVGGAKAEYTPWLDFGGRVGRGKSVSRPFIREGRYVYPTLREKDKEVRAKVDEVLERLARAAGFDTEGNASG
jgi:Bacteriophage HK97-gp10, putative tail-component